MGFWFVLFIMLLIALPLLLLLLLVSKILQASLPNFFVDRRYSASLLTLWYGQTVITVKLSDQSLNFFGKCLSTDPYTWM